MLRVQEILCGYVRPESGDDPVMIGKKNPRLEAALDYLEALGHPAIIWSRFSPDVQMLVEGLNARGLTVGRYDGKISDDECEETKQGFQRGDIQFFVGNQQKGAEGLTLTQARTMMYYCNSFNFIHRLQSEDRAHRIGQEHPVNYVDVVGVMPDQKLSMDGHVVASLRDKYDIATKITGDRLKDWI